MTTRSRFATAHAGLMLLLAVATPAAAPLLASMGIGPFVE